MGRKMPRIVQIHGIFFDILYAYMLQLRLVIQLLILLWRNSFVVLENANKIITIIKTDFKRNMFDVQMLIFQQALCHFDALQVYKFYGCNAQFPLERPIQRRSAHTSRTRDAIQG